MAKVVVFDMTGTLLDVGVLDPHFERAFGNARVRQEWFHTLERLWLVELVTNTYTPFSTLAKAALQLTAAERGVAVSHSDQAAILDGMQQLPPFADVADVLAQLRDAHVCA